MTFKWQSDATEKALPKLQELADGKHDSSLREVVKFLLNKGQGNEHTRALQRITLNGRLYCLLLDAYEAFQDAPTLVTSAPTLRVSTTTKPIAIKGASVSVSTHSVSLLDDDSDEEPVVFSQKVFVGDTDIDAIQGLQRIDGTITVYLHHTQPAYLRSIAENGLKAGFKKGIGLPDSGQPDGTAIYVRRYVEKSKDDSAKWA